MTLSGPSESCWAKQNSSQNAFGEAPVRVNGGCSDRKSGQVFQLRGVITAALKWHTYILCLQPISHLFTPSAALISPHTVSLPSAWSKIAAEYFSLPSVIDAAVDQGTAAARAFPGRRASAVASKAVGCTGWLLHPPPQRKHSSARSRVGERRRAFLAPFWEVGGIICKSRRERRAGVPRESPLPWPLWGPGKHRPTCHQPSASAAPSSHFQAAHFFLLEPSCRSWSRGAGRTQAAAARLWGGSHHCKPSTGASSPAAEMAAASPNLCPACVFAAGVGVSAHWHQQLKPTWPLESWETVIFTSGWAPCSWILNQVSFLKYSAVHFFP